MKKILLSMLLLAASAFALVSCKSDDDNTTEPEGSVKRVYDFSADTLENGTHFALFSFENKAKVAIADSATTKWDIGFQKTTIILNSGVRGPGNVEVSTLTQTSFSDVKQAPAYGYIPDSTLEFTAIPGGSGNGWYTYDQSHLISPIAGKIFVFKLANGKYAKMRIINYYKGHPSSPNPVTDKGRYYSFEYQISDTTGKFE